MYGLHPRNLKMVKLVHELHEESPREMKLKNWLHHGCLDGDHRSPGVVKLVMGLHHWSPRVVKLEVGLHHGGPDSDHRSPRGVKLVMGLHHGSPMKVKLEVGFYQGCYIREQEVSRGGEASDMASSPKVQEDEVYDGTLPWEFQRA